MPSRVRYMKRVEVFKAPKRVEISEKKILLHVSRDATVCREE